MSDVTDRLTETLAGRYAIEREVGRGGMATVYLAEDLKHHRQVAVKVLNAELAAAVGPERFVREIEIAARLSHPHILPLYDSGELDGTLYYVMPYVEGESLQDRLDREKQVGIGEAVGIAREVADALSHAHAHAVIHRDIKPANIMLVARHAMVADFGVALLVQAVAPDRLTESGVALGTPLYMSPEQSSGHGQVDGRSDIYALGCVLYEMLTGEPPFTGATSQVILAKKLTSDPVPIRLVRESVSEELEAIVAKALARTAADRYRTAAEFADALAEVPLEQHESRLSEWAARAERSDRQWVRPHIREVTPPRGRRPHPLVVAAVVVLLPTAAGFLSTTVYDHLLRVPHQFTPSRWDFPVIGVRALIAPLYAAFVLLVGYVLAKQVVRLIALAARRSQSMSGALHRWPRRVTRTWQRLTSTTQPGTLAEIWFTCAILASAAVIGWFVSIVQSADHGIFGFVTCEYRETHRSFVAVMPVLIVLLGVTWHGVFRRPGSGTGLTATLSRWGGIVLIVGLILFMTAPWRLLFTESPRALLDGERVYIVRETGSTLLLYNPRTRTTEPHRTTDVPQLQRLNTTGYLFESEEAFGRPRSGC